MNLTGALDSGKHGPRVVVVVEEIADLLPRQPGRGRRAWPGWRKWGAGLGVHLIGVTQQPGARSLGDALANFPARLSGAWPRQP